MHLAVINGEPKIVENLLETSLMEMNIKDEHDLTPLHYACLASPSEKNFKIVEALINNPKTKASIVTENNWTALHFALFNKNMQVASKLLENVEIDLSSRLKGGITLLHLATSTGAIDVVKKFINKKSKHRFCNGGGIHSTSFRGNEKRN